MSDRYYSVVEGLSLKLAANLKSNADTKNLQFRYYVQGLTYDDLLGSILPLRRQFCRVTYGENKMQFKRLPWILENC